MSAGFAGLSEQPEIAARNFSTKDDIGEFWEWETGTNGIAAGTVGGACGHWRVDPRKVARDVKLGLLKNHFRPDRKFSFPARQVGKKQLKFQCSWLEQNPWLVYSPRTNAGFCLPCTLFGGEEDRFGHQLGQLHRSPMVSFGRSTTMFKTHREQPSHLAAIAKCSSFMDVEDTGMPDITQQMLDHQGKMAQENAEKLKAILDVIIFCGKQNISLRGHRNEDWRPGSDEKPDGNPGNFLALLHFRSEAGDASISRPFHVIGGAGRPVLYTSPEIQNELIACCGDVMREELLREVRKAPFFAVLADEAVDSANIEQMPIVLRFVDTDLQVREEFIGFAACTGGTTGQALQGVILQHLADWQLDFTRLRGQGYDGAGNMAGRLNGCAALVQEQYPKATYFHCASHALNLCIMSTSKIVEVTDMWTVLKEVSFFFSSSPKRQSKLEDVIKGMPADLLSNTAKTKLVDLCRTRWVARHTALVTFLELYEAVVATFEEISDNGNRSWNPDSVSKASALVRSITDFRFIVTFSVVSNVLAYIHPLTIQLQKTDLDMCQAYASIERVQESLSRARTSVHERHRTWWSEAMELAKKVSRKELGS